jgi:two-component system capsular synthesis sensor histidine kinase RcsC
MSEFTILLLEDDDDLRQVYLDLLAQMDAAVLEASNGQQALDILRRRKVGLVIADVHMPRMSGIDFLKALRVLDRETIVVFASGVLDRHVFNEGAKLGVFDYFDKIDMKGFSNVVGSARRYWESRAASHPASRL